MTMSVKGPVDQAPWLPAADIVETDRGYSIEIELPGVRREDVDVDLIGNELVVIGEAKKREREGLFRHRTRRVGEFEIRVALPGRLRAPEVELSLAYGVLKVYVPKESTETNSDAVTDSGDGSR